MARFLDNNGLEHFWAKIKEKINTKQDALTAGNNIAIDNNVISAESTAKFSYNSSTYAEVDAAYNDGKSCEMVKIEDDGSLIVAKLMYGHIDEDVSDGSYYLFVTITAEGQIAGYIVWSDDTWSVATFGDDPYYQKAALVTSLTASSDHAHYPSAKAVYDALQSAGGGNVFLAEYNSTTFQAIRTAFAAKKIIFVYRSASGGGYYGYMTRCTAVKAYFTYVHDGVPTCLTCTNADVWTYYAIPLLKQSDLVTSLSDASDDTHVPSAKCVYDAIQSASGAVDSVNGKTGTVVLTANDVGAAKTEHKHTLDDLGSFQPVELTMKPNTYVETNGTEKTYTGWTSTDFIPVEPGKRYQLYWNVESKWCCWYKSDQSFLSQVKFSVGMNDIFAPENAAFLRVSNNNGAMATLTVRAFQGGLEMVKTVNGISPDSNGNVALSIPSLDGYATEAYVDNAITAAIGNIDNLVGSGVIA